MSVNLVAIADKIRDDAAIIFDQNVKKTFECLLEELGLIDQWLDIPSADMFVAGGAVTTGFMASSLRKLDCDVDVFFRSSREYIHLLEAFLMEFRNRYLSRLRDPFYGPSAIKECDVKEDEIPFINVANPDCFGIPLLTLDSKVPDGHVMAQYYLGVPPWNNDHHCYINLNANSIIITYRGVLSSFRTYDDFKAQHTYGPSIEYNFVTNPRFICPTNVSLVEYMQRFDFTICAAAYDPSAFLKKFIIHPAWIHSFETMELEPFHEIDTISPRRVIKYVNKGYCIPANDLEMQEKFGPLINDFVEMEHHRHNGFYDIEEDEKRRLQERFSKLDQLISINI